MGKRLNLEHEEQKALFQWIDTAKNQYPLLNLIFAIPNAGKRHPAVGGKMIAEGLRKGVPDICLPVAAKGAIGMFIEMKFGKNRPTADQLLWMKMLSAAGHRVIVCYSWIDAACEICEYLSLPPPLELGQSRSP